MVYDALCHQLDLLVIIILTLYHIRLNNLKYYYVILQFKFNWIVTNPFKYGSYWMNYLYENVHQFSMPFCVVYTYIIYVMYIICIIYVIWHFKSHLFSAVHLFSKILLDMYILNFLFPFKYPKRPFPPNIIIPELHNQ